MRKSIQAAYSTLQRRQAPAAAASPAFRESLCAPVRSTPSAGLNLVKSRNPWFKIAAPAVLQVLLEGISTSQPQPKLPSELIKFIGKNFCAWHTAIPLLESHVMLFPHDPRCFDSLVLVRLRLSCNGTCEKPVFHDADPWGGEGGEGEGGRSWPLIAILSAGSSSCLAHPVSQPAAVVFRCDWGSACNRLVPWCIRLGQQGSVE